MKKLIAVVGVLLSFMLAGCSNAGVAATVGNKSITLKDFQAQIDSILQERKAVDTSQMQLETGEDLARSHLSYMIAILVIDSIGEENKVKVSQSEIDAYRNEILTNIGGEANLPNVLVNAAIPADFLDDVLRRDLIIRALSNTEKAKGSDDATINESIKKLVQDKATSLKIVVNPRYGTWDSVSLSVVASEAAGDAVKTK